MRPQRIIHVTNFGFKPVKAYFHNTGVKLSNGWIRSGHHVINFSDRDIARWNSFLGYRPWGAAAANCLLRDLCRNTQPDVIAFGHADVITKETIAQLRADLPGVKMLQWNIDWVVPAGQAQDNDPTAENNKKRLLGKSALMDATFITTAGEALKEIPAFFMPNPVDLSIEHGRNFDSASLPFDVFFASNAENDWRFHAGQWREMNAFCRDMSAALPQMRFLLPGVNGTPKVFGPDYQAVLEKCRIGLNISRRNDARLYSSDRLAQMAGNGLAVCIDRASGYNDIFSDEEMVFYSSESELFEKLLKLKRDDDLRRRIAERGWKRYSTLFNSTVVAQYMLDVVFGKTAQFPGV
jgi:hypothetical protein